MIKLTEDLRRWFKEKWTAQDGSECGDYKGRGRVKCRPSRRVSEKSPQTWGEMSKEEKKKAVRKKQEAHRKGKQFSSHKTGKTWDGPKNKYRPKKNIKEDAQLPTETGIQYRTRLLRNINSGDIAHFDTHDRIYGAMEFLKSIQPQYKRGLDLVVRTLRREGSGQHASGLKVTGIDSSGRYLSGYPTGAGGKSSRHRQEITGNPVASTTLHLSHYSFLSPEHRTTLQRIMNLREEYMLDLIKKYITEKRNKTVETNSLTEEKKPYKGFKKGKNHPEGGLSRAEARRQGIRAGIETKDEAKRKGGFGKLSKKTQKRRKSFCARMCGMKRRRTSSKTANDPKSKINAALRVWGCRCGTNESYVPNANYIKEQNDRFPLSNSETLRLKQLNNLHTGAKETLIGKFGASRGKRVFQQTIIKLATGKTIPKALKPLFSKSIEEVDESVQLTEANKPTNKKLWSKAKALARQKFDVYPSAYANAWAAKWYKKRGGGWRKSKKEAVTEETTMSLNIAQQQVKQKFLTEGCGCGKPKQPKQPKPRPKSLYEEKKSHEDEIKRLEDRISETRAAMRERIGKHLASIGDDSQYVTSSNHAGTWTQNGLDTPVSSDKIHVTTNHNPTDGTIGFYIGTHVPNPKHATARPHTQNPTTTVDLAHGIIYPNGTIDILPKPARTSYDRRVDGTIDETAIKFILSDHLASPVRHPTTGKVIKVANHHGLQNPLIEEVVNDSNRGTMTKTEIKKRDSLKKKLGRVDVVKKGDTPENAAYRLATFITLNKRKRKKKG